MVVHCQACFAAKASDSARVPSFPVDIVPGGTLGSAMAGSDPERIVRRRLSLMEVMQGVRTFRTAEAFLAVRIPFGRLTSVDRYVADAMFHVILSSFVLGLRLRQP